MGLMVADNGGDFEQLPAGTYIARCFQVVDLGTQKTIFEGKENWRGKVRLVFEVLDEDVKMADGSVFTISSDYTATLSKKGGLRKMLDGWRGTPFTDEELKGWELSKVAGVYAQITVVHNPSADGSKTYTNIASVAGLHKSIPKPTPVNPVLIFDMSAPDHLDHFNKLPEWTRKKIEASREWATPKPTPKPAPAPSGTIPPQDDWEDIPF